MISPRCNPLVRIVGILLITLIAPTTPATAAINIVAIGDSITQGGTSTAGNITKNFAYASYRYPLYFQFKDAGYDINFVGPGTQVYQEDLGRKVSTVAPNPAQNEKGPYYPLYENFGFGFDKNHAAYWGKTSGALLNSAQTNFLAWANAIPTTDTPDIALINIGTNDASGGIAVTTFTTNLATLISKLRTANPNITIILSNLIGTGAAWDTNIVSYNTAIASFVNDPANSTPTSSIVMADVRTGFDKTAWLYDNLHPNQDGEIFMAGVYFDAITTTLIPEPATLALLTGIAVITTTWTMRRRRAPGRSSR